MPGGRIRERLGTRTWLTAEKSDQPENLEATTYTMLQASFEIGRPRKATLK